MQARLPLAILLLACTCAAGAEDSRAAAQQSASTSYRIMSAVHSHTGGQDHAMRRCRAYMDEANSAEKLGSRDMASKNWDKAARGCKAEAMSACMVKKSAAPEDCAGVSRLYP